MTDLFCVVLILGTPSTPVPFSLKGLSREQGRH
jgi:hypothetical protein